MEKQEHINPAFDVSLQQMEALLQQMEDAVQSQIENVRQAFKEMSEARARAVREKDAHLNRLAVEMETQTVTILAKHQPMADDLRRVIAALKMSIEYERGGDYVKNLAKSISRLAAHNENLEVFPALQKMLDDVGAMFAEYVASRRGGDLPAAERVWARDHRIDDLCSEAVREAYENLENGDGNIHSLIHAVSVAKNSERIGDKIKNLVEIYYRQRTGSEFSTD